MLENSFKFKMTKFILNGNIPKQQRDSAQIPPDDVPADSGFFDKKYGIHVIRTYVLGAESIRNGDFNASTKGW